MNDVLVLDKWHSARGEPYEVEVDLNWKPRLRVEYYEDAGDARIRYAWERIR